MSKLKKKKELVYIFYVNVFVQLGTNHWLRNNNSISSLKYTLLNEILQNMCFCSAVNTCTFLTC